MKSAFGVCVAAYGDNAAAKPSAIKNAAERACQINLFFIATSIGLIYRDIVCRVMEFEAVRLFDK